MIGGKTNGPDRIACSGLLYWFEAYGFAFWVLAILVANHVFGTIRAYSDPSWYRERRRQFYFERGWWPDYSLFDGPGAGLAVSKAIVLAVELPIAWHIASRAGYV